MTPFQFKEKDVETAYKRHADVLYRLALSYMKQKEDAEDVVQDTFVRYFCGFHLPMSEEQERAWLIRVTINRCHDLLRKRSYRMHDPLEDVTDLTAAENPEAKELLELVWNLPEKYKDVIILHYLEGYSVEEAARILGVSPSAIKMRLKRGRESLKEELEKE